MPSRTALLMGALWLSAVTGATTVGAVAVSQVGRQVGDRTLAPLTNDAIHQALASASAGPSASATPAPSAPADPGDGPPRTVSTRGGVVSGRCRDGDPQLLLASPYDGYRTERSDTDGALVIRFVRASRQVVVTVRCVEDQVVLTSQALTGSGPTAPTLAPSPSDSQSDGPREPASSDSSAPRSSPAASRSHEPADARETPEPTESPDG